jgi:hypothetical protein
MAGRGWTRRLQLGAGGVVVDLRIATAQDTATGSTG